MEHIALQRAFAGRKVLVTGHTGFKGGWLCLWLRMLGAEVTGIALPPPPGPSLFESAGIGALVDHRIGDIRAADDFARAVEGVNADIVFHLAAQSIVRLSYQSPVDTYLANVVGTAIVLDAARHMDRLRAAIVVTSDKCYENREWHWPYREEDRLGGADPYSSSKGCAELVTSAWRRSFFAHPGAPGLASARAGNVIGGGDWAVDRLVPDIMRAAIAGDPVHIRNPQSVRPWQHVLEPLHGYLTLGAHLLSEGGERFAQAWNFGPNPGDFVDVRTVAEGICRAWGEGGPAFRFGPLQDQPHEARMLTVDSSKAHAALGWRPRLSIDDAVAMTAQWYRAFAGGNADLRVLSERQIELYAGASPMRTPNDEKGEMKQCA